MPSDVLFSKSVNINATAKLRLQGESALPLIYCQNVRMSKLANLGLWLLLVLSVVLVKELLPYCHGVSDRGCSSCALRFKVPDLSLATIPSGFSESSTQNIGPSRVNYLSGEVYKPLAQLSHSYNFKF